MNGLGFISIIKGLLHGAQNRFFIPGVRVAHIIDGGKSW